MMDFWRYFRAKGVRSNYNFKKQLRTRTVGSTNRINPKAILILNIFWIRIVNIIYIFKNVVVDGLWFQNKFSLAGIWYLALEMLFNSNKRFCTKYIACVFMQPKLFQIQNALQQDSFSHRWFTHSLSPRLIVCHWWVTSPFRVFLRLRSAGKDITFRPVRRAQVKCSWAHTKTPEHKHCRTAVFVFCPFA